MIAADAPLYNDVAEGPADGRAFWLTCADGVKIRAAIWGQAQAKHGTVLLFPGRTEYIEKYGRSAAELALRGFATVVIDWRGQGLAQRLLPERHLGHVGEFRDYQADIAALMALVDQEGLPKPLSLFAHSMGGCIGLRALTRGLPVQAVTFSGPMWGIALGLPKRAAGWALSTLAHKFGLGNAMSPGSEAETYVLGNPFADNMLTTDAEMYDYMKRQVTKYPDLALGGPTLSWLNEALRECRALRAHPTPDIPCLTLLGTNERIVDADDIKDRMARWANGELMIIQDGEHETVMEGPKTQKRIFDKVAELYKSAA